MENDQTSLYHTAKGLMTLQALYGTIPQIYGKGECARVGKAERIEQQSILLRVDWYLLSVFFCLLLACCQHDAEDEKGVCRYSESDPARV